MLISERLIEKLRNWPKGHGGAGRGRGLSTEAAQVGPWRAADPIGLSFHLVSEIKLEVDDKDNNMIFA